MVSVMSSPALTSDAAASRAAASSRAAAYHDYFETASSGAAAAAAYCNPLPSVPADEATIDAYATQVLEQSSSHSDAEYLGPYLTGLLRCSHKEAVDEGRTTTATSPKDLPDYENFLELLQEHCTLARDEAERTLTKIADAVLSTAVPHSFQQHIKNNNNHQFHDSFSSYASGSNRHHHNHVVHSVTSPLVGPFGSPPVSGNGLDALPLLGNGQFSQPELTDDDDSHVPSSTNSISGAINNGADVVVSPVQPDNLIPVDLLGALDEEPVQNQHQQQQHSRLGNHAPPYSSPLHNSATASLAEDDEFPPLGAAAAPMTKKAARASRSRQGSIDDQSSASSATKPSPRLQPQSNPLPPAMELSSTLQAYYNPYGSYQQQQQQQQGELSSNDMAEAVHMACDMILNINPDIGNDAAWHATMMGQGDVGVAQYILDSALNAPPVCRHLLHSGCYRADCTFSHDLDGHTCVFWLRGRCGKGTSCQFLHGFGDKILEELNRQQEEHMEQHQQQMQQMQQQFQNGGDQALYDSTAAGWDRPASSSATTTAAASSSFANIASQGYNDQTCFQSSNNPAVSAAGAVNRYQTENTELGSNHGSNNGTSNHVPSVRIPQDVWNPHERRDASAFHIADPIERYMKVQLLHANNGSVKPRTDVIDLHFQSTKTFATVLAQVLPEKLASESNGVWIVTGTGHHVGTKTHQKGGGILESAVITWLSDEGYNFAKGKDRNGHGGALYVVR